MFVNLRRVKTYPRNTPSEAKTGGQIKYALL